jgi:predicted membrane protein
MPPEPLTHVTRRPRFTPQMLFGLMVIVAGLLMTLDNLGVLHAEDYVRYWPAGLIAVGMLKLWHSREGSGGGFGGFLFTVAGTWLLLEQAAVVRLSFWDMWPTLLVFVGGFLVWQGLSGPRVREVPDGRVHTNATISAMAVLGAVSRGNNSPAFRGGELTAVMGGCEIDLRHAAIDGEAVIEIFAWWGGIDIRVPEDWTVVSTVVPIMGGVDDKTRPPQGASRHRLVLRGFVVMAGVEVKN